MIKSFDDFIPEPELFPPEATKLVTEIVTESLGILRGRSVAEFNTALSTLNWMLERMKTSDFMQKMHAVAADEGLELPNSDKDHLLIASTCFDIKDQPGFNNATWPEYYAVLALQEILKGLHAARRAAEIEKVNDGYGRLGYATVPFLDAMATLVLSKSLANHFSSIEEYERRAEFAQKEKLSQKNQQAALARYETLSTVKRECIGYYLKNNHLSMDEAARRFWKTVDPTIKKELALKDPVRTFSKTLSQYKNDKLPPHIFP